MFFAGSRIKEVIGSSKWLRNYCSSAVEFKKEKRRSETYGSRQYQPSSVIPLDRSQEQGLLTYEPKTKVVRRDEFVITQENQYNKLAEAVTPLWKMPYVQQLNMKFITSREFLKCAKEYLRKLNVDLDSKPMYYPPYLPCKLKVSLPSPKHRNYRNKDEFVVHVGVDGFTPTVGFCIGPSIAVSRAVCVNPRFLNTIKRDHTLAAQFFESFVQSSSLPTTHNLERNFWRKLLVRSNHRGELMLSATMHAHNLTKAEIDDQKRFFCEYFSEGPGTELDIKSLYFQTSGLLDKQPPRYEHLWGETHLLERQGDLNLSFSIQTQLLENTSMGEVLFPTLTELLDLKPHSTLLDVGCGVGLHLSQKAIRVIGVKNSQGTIGDLYRNSSLNGISNITYTQRSLETVLQQLKHQDFTDLVAVVNSSQKCLGKVNVRLLKDIKSLRRIVILTSTLDEFFLNDLLWLSKMSDSNECVQFFPMEAIPIDVFPQTNDFNFLVVFDRVK